MNRNRVFRIITLLTLLAVCAVFALAQQKAVEPDKKAAEPAKKVAGPAGKTAIDVAFPTGYRHWTHVKSMLIHAKTHPLFATFGGIHHVYANAKAADGLKSGNYVDGSIFVFDLLDDINQAGAYVEGKRKLLAVMAKDSKRYAATGGWGFEAWGEGDTKKSLVQNATDQCFKCHSSQKNTDYVYSSWRP